jgi:hypothetical protein
LLRTGHAGIVVDACGNGKRRVVEYVSARRRLPVFLDSAHFVRQSLPVLARLVNDCGGQQLRRIEFSDREAFEPRFLTAREAMKLRPPDVPHFDVNAIRTALAEEEDSHRRRIAPERTKSKT